MTILIISGVTCAGKSHLADRLIAAGIAKVVTTTTRQPRAGEINGIHYNFVTEDEFSRIEAAGGFAETNRFSGSNYGVAIKDIPSAGNASVIVDPNGHRNIKRFLKGRGIPYLSVFMDADEGNQALRFMMRARQELEAARAAGKLASTTIKGNAKRMTHMLTTEEHWRDVARCREAPYDLIVQDYRPASQGTILEEIQTRMSQA